MRVCSCTNKHSVCETHLKGEKCAALTENVRYCTYCKQSSQARHPSKPTFQTPELPEEDRPIEELLEARRSESDRHQKANTARRFVEVTINVDGPIGIMNFGDPHMDDPGCRFRQLERDTSLCTETEGMFGGCVGDLTNNWIGRLSHLWGQQEVTARECCKLAEWWIDTLSPKLLYLIEGNHDGWARGTMNVSPLEWMMSRSKGVFSPHGIRVGLKTPSGEMYTMNARHDHRGRSQFNPAHGQTKSFLFGYHDDLNIAGHIHTGGSNTLYNIQNERVCHAVRLSSYKRIDKFAFEKGFQEAPTSECVTWIINPYVEDRRWQTFVIYDPVLAVDTLTMLREKWKNGKGKSRQPRR